MYYSNFNLICIIYFIYNFFFCYFNLIFVTYIIYIFDIYIIFIFSKHFPGPQLENPCANAQLSFCISHILVVLNHTLDVCRSHKILLLLKSVSLLFLKSFSLIAINHSFVLSLVFYTDDICERVVCLTCGCHI